MNAHLTRDERYTLLKMIERLEQPPARRVELRPHARVAPYTIGRPDVAYLAQVVIVAKGEHSTTSAPITGVERFKDREDALVHAVRVAHSAARAFANQYGPSYEFFVELPAAAAAASLQ